MILKALRMTNELIEKVQAQANKEERSFSSMVRVLVARGLKHS